jgi:hypothetical protein
MNCYDIREQRNRPPRRLLKKGSQVGKEPQKEGDFVIPASSADKRAGIQSFFELSDF